MPDGSLVRELLRGSDRAAALEADREREQAAADDAERAAIERLEPFTRARQGTYFGNTPGTGGEWLRVMIPHRVALTQSLWIQGVSGGGKTTFLNWLTYQDFQTPNLVVCALDYQGAESGYSRQLLTRVIPGLIAQRGAEWGAEFLRGLRVIAPWQSRKLPTLHITATGGNVNQRAASLVDIFASTTGIGNAEFGPRMLSCTMPSVRLAMRLGLPFPLIPDLMTNEALRTKLVARCGDSALVSYMRDRFLADYRDAGPAVLSRFDRLLGDDATKLATFAPEPFDAADRVEHGWTIANFGGGPVMHRAAWVALTQKATLDAILARRTTKRSPRVVVRVDEAQVGLVSTVQAKELDDALSRMRGRKAALTIAHQHAGQLGEYASLKESLRTNCGLFATFRVPPQSFGSFGCDVPGPLPGMDPTLAAADTRAAWEHVIENLPKRTYLLRVPDLSSATIPVRAPEFDVEALARNVPRELVELVEEGTHGFDRRELAARETAWREALSELTGAADPNMDALARLAEGRRTRGRSRRAMRVEEGEQA